MKTLLRKLAILSVTSVALFSASTAFACPMCKIANEIGEADQTPEENARPIAYMYSIFFMLSMPVTMTAGIGYSLYKMNRHESRILAESEESNE